MMETDNKIEGVILVCEITSFIGLILGALYLYMTFHLPNILGVIILIAAIGIAIWILSELRRIGDLATAADSAYRNAAKWQERYVEMAYYCADLEKQLQIDTHDS